MIFFVRYHHSINVIFDRHRYPPVPATARGTCRVRGCRRHPTLDNSMTAGPIGFKFGVSLLLQTSHIAINFTQVRCGVHLHVRTGRPLRALFAISQTAGRTAFKFCIWLRDPLDKSFAQVRDGVHLHVRTCTLHTPS